MAASMDSLTGVRSVLVEVASMAASMAAETAEKMVVLLAARMA